MALRRKNAPCERPSLLNRSLTAMVRSLRSRFQFLPNTRIREYTRHASDGKGRGKLPTANELRGGEGLQLPAIPTESAHKPPLMPNIACATAPAPSPPVRTTAAPA